MIMNSLLKEMEQMHSYASINMQDKIETPDDDYEADKIGKILQLVNYKKNEQKIFQNNK